jgi:hypothetical protein
VPVEHVFGHSFGNVVAELFDLFLDVVQKMLCWTSNQSSWWGTEQLPNNMVIAVLDLIKCVPISSFLICSTSLAMAWAVSFIAAITCLDVTWLILLNYQKVDMGVLSFVPLGLDSVDNGCSHPNRAHVDIPKWHLHDCVVFLILLLHLEGDQYAVGEFKVQITVLN